MSDDKRPVDADGKSVRAVTKNGRGVLIYRQYKTRGDERVYSRDWTRRVVRQNRQYFFNLGPKLVDASKYADRIEAFLEIPGHTIEMAVAKFAPDKRDRPDNATTTIGDILAAFSGARAALDVAEQTFKESYRDRLLWFIRYVKAARSGRPMRMHTGQRNIDFSRELDTPLSFLDRQSAADFKTAIVAEAKGSPVLELKKKRSANSTMRNVKALFSEPAREHYAHLVLPPELDGFMASKPFRKVRRKYEFPPADVVQRIFADLYELRDGDPDREIFPDHNAFVALLLGVAAGLRKDEIAHARRGWLRENEGAKLRHRIRVQAETDFLPKGRDAGYAEITDWALREILKASASTPYLLEGSKTERGEATFRRLNAWLRKRGLTGPDRDHPCHQLRAMYGSWVASTFDMFTAKTWCRHASIRTTEEYYADLILSTEVLALWDPRGEIRQPKSRSAARG